MTTLIVLILIILLIARVLPRQRRHRARRTTAYAREFARVRPMILRRDGYRCRRCHRAGVPLHVHHVRYRSRGGSNAPSNLETLCPNCHHAAHRRHF